MLLIGAILGVGLLLGLGLGGDPRKLVLVRIRAWWLAPLALALQSLPVPRPGGEPGRFAPAATLAVSFLLLAIVAGINLRHRGFGVILVGLILNLSVIIVNQGMPVSAHALREIGHPEDIEELATARRGEKHHLATEEDLLRPLGDVIAVRAPFDSVMSPGDVLIYGGGAVFLAAAMLGRSRRARETDESLVPRRRATRS